MNEKRAREIVRGRSGDVCERCGSARATNMHHRKNRSQGGQWLASNLLHLCGSGTTGCHGFIGGHPVVSYEQGWMVRRVADPAKSPVWLFGWGFVFLTDAGDVEVFEESA